MPKNQTSWKPGQVANPKGAPKKEWSLTQAMRDLLSEVDPQTKLTKRDLFVQKTLEQAAAGDPTSKKLIWNYIEGMPQQKVDHTSGGEKIVPIYGGKSVQNANGDTDSSSE